MIPTDAGRLAPVISAAVVNVGVLPGYRCHYLARIWAPRAR